MSTYTETYSTNSSGRIVGNTGKVKYDNIINSLKSGNSVIQFGDTPISITKSSSNTPAILSAFKDSNGTGLMENLLPAARTDRWQVNGIADNLSNNFSGVTSNISDSISSGIDSVGSAVSGAMSEVGSRVGEVSNVISGYISPVLDSLEAINNIGKKFDECIKDTFLVQTFKLKGSEILCMAFCIVVSFLPCDVRKRMYQALVDIRAGLQGANSAINEFNRVTQDPVEMPISSKGSIAQNVASLFGDNTKALKDWQDSFTAGRKTNTVNPNALKVPDSVKTIVSNIIMVLSILSKGQITLPVGINGNLWSLMQVVMNVVKMMMMQMVDEFLTKIVSKIETMLRKMVPQNCVGNLAAAFINKIIAAIKDLKNYLLEILKGLFGESEAFSIKWKKFGWYFKEIGELLAFLKALQLILSKFPDLIMACGITPCEDDPRSQAIRDALNSGKPIPMTNIPANIKPLAQTPIFDNLDDLSKNFAGMINIDPGTVFIDKNAIHVSIPQPYQGAPALIQKFIEEPEFLTALGENYTVYKDSGSTDMTIVYTFKRMCGE